MNYLDELAQEIRKKPELCTVSLEFIIDKIQKYVSVRTKIQKKLELSGSFEKFQHSKEYDQILKAVRLEIRKAYGLFQLAPRERKDLLKGFAQVPEQDKEQMLTKILETHRSTKERLEIYPEIYEDIFKITGKPRTLLDIGCGLNPLAFRWIGIPKLKYIAVELSEEDVKLINDYFKLDKVDGKAYAIDLIKDYHKLSGFDADVCLMFKLLDSLEVVEYGISEKLIKSISAKHIVASFSTKSVGGKKMRSARRQWFENLVHRLGFKFEILEYDNELFYMLSK